MPITMREALKEADIEQVVKAARLMTSPALDAVLSQMMDTVHIRFVDGPGPRSGETPHFEELEQTLRDMRARYGDQAEVLQYLLWVLGMLQEGSGDFRRCAIDLQSIRERVKDLPKGQKKTVEDVIRKLENGPAQEVDGTYSHPDRLITIYRSSAKDVAMTFAHELFHGIHHHLRDAQNPSSEGFDGDARKRAVVLESFATAFELKLALALGKTAYAQSRIAELMGQPIHFYPYSGALDLIDVKDGSFKADHRGVLIQVMAEKSFRDINGAYREIWSDMPLGEFKVYNTLKKRIAEEVAPGRTGPSGNIGIIGQIKKIPIYAVPDKETLFDLIKVYRCYTIALAFADGHVDIFPVNSFKGIGKADSICGNVKTNARLNKADLSRAVAVFVFSGNVGWPQRSGIHGKDKGGRQMNLELVMEVLAEIPDEPATPPAAPNMGALFDEPVGFGTYSYLPSIPNTAAPFHEILKSKIAECFKKNPECYDAIDMDRRYFNNYIKGKAVPDRENTYRLAIALRLPLKEAEEFLAAAGWAFRPSEPLDVIVKEHIRQGVYSPYEINDTLYSQGVTPLFFQGKKKRGKTAPEE